MIFVSLHIQSVLFLIHLHHFVFTYDQIKLYFYGGFNLIRCSHEEYQVIDDVSFSGGYNFEDILACANKDDIYFKNYIGFYWDRLDLVCDIENNFVYEEIYLEKIETKLLYWLPNAKIWTKPKVAGTEITTESKEGYKLITIASPMNATDFYRPVNNLYERRFYLTFGDHRVICRIRYYDDDLNPCTSFNNVSLSDIEYACYYYPLLGHVPTIEEFEAQLIADEQDPSPPNPNQPKPATAPPPSSDIQDPSKNAGKSGYSQIKPHQPHSPEKKRDRKPMIIGIVIVIVVVCIAVGLLVFFFIRHSKSKSDPSGISEISANPSDQSIPTGQSNDHLPNHATEQEKSVMPPPKVSEMKRKQGGGNTIFGGDLQ